MHSIVAYAGTLVTGDVSALTVFRLPSAASEIAVLKGTDIWITARIFDESSALARRVGPVVETRDPVINPFIITIFVRFTGRAVCSLWRVQAECFPQMAIGVSIAATGIRDRRKLISPAIRETGHRRVARGVILYLKGVSTGDFAEALAALLGKDAPGLSASTFAVCRFGLR